MMLISNRSLQFRVVALASLGFVLLTTQVLLAPPAALAADDIIIEATTLRPPLLRTTAGHRVNFINRSGRMVHVEFLHDPAKHQVIQVPDQIWTIFHESGRHPYVVHFPEARSLDLYGVVEVMADPRGRPDPQACVGITVMGTCLER